MKVLKSYLKTEMLDFLELRKSTRSHSTFIHDCSVIYSFDEFLNKKNYSGKLFPEDFLAEYFSTLNGCSKTIADYVSKINCFLKYLEKMGYTVFISEIPKVKINYTPYIFSDEEIVEIFSNLDEMQFRKPYNEVMKFRMSMLVRILYATGIRVGEALNLQIKDIDFENGILFIKEAKGYKQRYVPMHITLTEMLEKYCFRMGIISDLEKYLFSVDGSNEPIMINRARYSFRKTVEKSSVNYHRGKWHERGPCMHCLRHCFVFHSFRKVEKEGMSINDAIPYLSIYLGHDSLNETDKYLEFNSEVFEEDMEKFSIFSMPLFPEVKNEE